MPQSKLLVDSNSYFRLAKSIHPLLGQVFGEENFCLYVLKELDQEYDNSRRLKTQFSWVDEDEYFTNRKIKLSLSRKDKNSIDIAYDVLWEHASSNSIGTSTIDTKYLAYGHVLNIPIITDDTGMKDLADVFDIQLMTSLELMSLMENCELIDRNKIYQIVAYWGYEIDKPANFRSDYIRLFNEDPPV